MSDEFVQKPQEKQSWFRKQFLPARISTYKYMFFFSLIAIAFGILEIAYQYYFIKNQVFADSLVSGFGFAGATLIALALLAGPLARLTKLNLLRHTRMIGIWGFLFALMHFNAVVNFFYLGNPAEIFLELNPFQNPLIWGFLAYIIFLLMFLTSNDWMQFKILKFKNWKNLQRLGYFAFIFMIIHFMVTNPIALFNLSGYLLFILTILTIVFQLTVFFKTIKKKNFKTLATLIGLIIILIGLILLYLTIVPVYFA